MGVGLKKEIITARHRTVVASNDFRADVVCRLFFDNLRPRLVLRKRNIIIIIITVCLHVPN